MAAYSWLQLDSLGFLPVILLRLPRYSWLLFDSVGFLPGILLRLPSYSWLLWVPLGFFPGILLRLPIAGFSGRPQERRSILVHTSPAQLSLQSEEDDNQNKVQRYCEAQL